MRPPFVAPWAALMIGFVAGVIVVLSMLAVERLRIDDPIGAIAAHGMAGVWGTLSLGFLALPGLAEALATGAGGFVYTGRSTSSARRSWAFLRSASSHSRHRSSFSGR